MSTGIRDAIDTKAIQKMISAQQSAEWKSLVESDLIYLARVEEVGPVVHVKATKMDGKIVEAYDHVFEASECRARDWDYQAVVYRWLNIGDSWETVAGYRQDKAHYQRRVVVAGVSLCEWYVEVWRGDVPFRFPKRAGVAAVEMAASLAGSALCDELKEDRRKALEEHEREIKLVQGGALPMEPQGRNETHDRIMRQTAKLQRTGSRPVVGIW